MAVGGMAVGGRVPGGKVPGGRVPGGRAPGSIGVFSPPLCHFGKLSTSIRRHCGLVPSGKRSRQ